MAENANDTQTPIKNGLRILFMPTSSLMEQQVAPQHTQVAMDWAVTVRTQRRHPVAL
jgi:hypothetical protein